MKKCHLHGCIHVGLICGPLDPAHDLHIIEKAVAQALVCPHGYSGGTATLDWCLQRLCQSTSVDFRTIQYNKTLKVFYSIWNGL